MGSTAKICSTATTTTVLPTTATVQTTASAVQHLTTETSSVSANSCPTKCWTAGTATVCSSATCRDTETVLCSTTTTVLCSAPATVQTTATTTTRPIKCPAPTGN